MPSHRGYVVVVKEYRKAIQKLEKEQDKLFAKACNKLGIDSQSRPYSDILFDHMFNNTTKTDEQIVEELCPVLGVATRSATKGPAKVTR